MPELVLSGVAATNYALRNARFPSADELAAALADVLGDNGLTVLAITAREPNIYSSTFPSEIVTCRLGAVRELRLLCKYGSKRYHSGFGHRGGIAYEEAVYRRVLDPLRLSTPALYGLHEARDSVWLFIEWLPASSRADKAPSQLAALRQAAGWIARFHRANASRADDLEFLTRYDAEYYRGWAERTLALAGGLRAKYPWLKPLCGAFRHLAEELLGAEQTVIHGEYTPHNVLVHGKRISPIDWEATAVGPGEIDLVSLTDKWPDDIVRACESEYRRARGSSDRIDACQRRLDIARLYWELRWLGNKRSWTIHEKSIRRFGHLRLVGERLGVI